MADGPSLGTAYLRVAGDFSHINTQAVGLFKSSQWAKYGKVAGAGIVTGLAAAGIAKALFDIGSEFDTAFDKIRTQSGATGKELGKLEGSFKKVVSSVPTDFGSAADAIAGLNQRLGLTGKPLNQLAKQLTALSKITETDVSSNVQSVTRLFGDWSVKTQKQTDTLDKLFRLTQDTGITIGDLSDSMVQFGSPLRQLGFHFDQAAAMFAAFEQQGVNTQTLLPGLRFAIKAFSGGVAATTVDLKKWGISLDDPAKGLQQVMTLIKDAPTDLKANAIAFEVFGQRAGPDMAAAIREGRFQLDDLIKGMSSGNETIRGTERQTRDFSEQWTLFANRMKVFVEPIATTVFKLLGDGMRELNLLFSGKGKFAEGVKSIIADLKEFWDQAGVVRAAVGALAAVAKTAWSAITAVFKAGAKIIKGIVETISGVLTGDFGRAWQGVKDLFSGSIHAVIGLVKGMFAPIITAAKAIGGALGDIFGGAWDKVTGIFKTAAGVLKDIVNWIISNVINRIPGVEIGIIGGSTPSSGADAASGPTGGGHSNPAHHYTGGKITKPTAIVGEEAPRHPEYVLATNPAYRKRNLQLWQQAGKEMGVPGFAKGGQVVSPIGQAVGTVTGSAGGFVDKLSNAPFGLLPGFMSGTGDWIKDKFTAFIKDKVSSAVTSTAGSIAGPTQTSIGPIIPMARAMVGKTWGLSQWPPFELLEEGEAGWDPHAQNPTSSAYGLAQNISPSTYPPAGRPGSTAPILEQARAQLAWMISYIKGRYGTPSVAYGTWLGRDPHWYAEGGIIGKLLKPGKQMNPDELALALALATGQTDAFAQGGVLGSMIAEASRMNALHSTYQYGGGHVTPAPSTPPWDCSSAVSRVLQAAGYDIPTMVSGSLASWGSPGTGPATIFANSAHTFMKLGSRYWGTSHANKGGGPGWVPASQYSPGYLATFAKRVPPGKVTTGSSGGSSGSSGGGSGPSPPNFDLNTGKAHFANTLKTGKADWALPSKIAAALKALRGNRPFLEEQIGNAQILDAMLSSPSGSDLSPAERAGEVALNTSLLQNLLGTVGWITKGLTKVPRGSKVAKTLTDELVGLQGLTGTGGDILNVRQVLDSLNVSSTSTATTGLDIAGLQAFSAAVRYGAFQHVPFGFAGGGTVPGPIGAPMPAVVHGGETVRTPAQEASLGSGRYEMVITNWEEGTGYFRRVAGDERTSADRTDHLTSRAGVR